MMSNLPGVHPRAHLILVLTGDPDEVGEHRVSISLLDPTGVVRLEHNGTLQLNRTPIGGGQIEAPGIIVLDLPIEQPGKHAFVIALDGKEEARVPFEVAIPVAGQPEVN